jgi:CO/xanthine dehydrogenase Mo-binding subunit
VSAPGGGWARVRCGEDALEVALGPGDPLDEVVLASFATGAAHMAAGWVCSEGLAVDAEGEVRDLTVRSFGVLTAEAMPRVVVTVDPDGAHGPPLAVGDAVFVAAAAAIWRRHGWEPAWPLGRVVW